MEEIKKIFLYVKTNDKSPYMTKKISAISDDERHRFDFETDLNNYDSSVEAMKSEFEKFCTVECGFDNFKTCKIYALDDMVLDVDLDEQTNILYWLNSVVRWCGCQTAEYEYNTKCFHLEHEWSFEEFKAANGYDETKEPFETKRLFNLFDEQVQKKEFSKQEINRIVQYISADNYRRLFDAIGKDYPMYFKFCNAICALSHADGCKYRTQISNMCKAVADHIRTMIKRFMELFLDTVLYDDYK